MGEGVHSILKTLAVLLDIFFIRCSVAVFSRQIRKEIEGAIFPFKRIGMAYLSTQDYLAVDTILSATDSDCTLQVLSQDKKPLLHI
ncbi:sodium/hydrogen exchanger 4-like [Macadamia integrifolia]|uniref:sodium/hydrogen exchanger 4-like n=1 Tax=Macadamia integrifolia TaxID=60698 RepID=UPI001C4FFFD8|nr:sodium/hydrogen exchanger 4-like [Macadamia integrifolia]